MSSNRPRCHNCKHGGQQFKAFGKTHLHCEHPEQYPENDLKNGDVSPWETLREFSDSCKDHEFKTPIPEPTKK